MSIKSSNYQPLELQVQLNERRLSYLPSETKIVELLPQTPKFFLLAN